MVHPVFVDDAERHHALKLAHGGRAVLLFLLGIGRLHEGEDALGHIVACERLQLFIGRDPDALREADVLKVAHHLEERGAVGQVRLLAEGTGDVGVHVEAHHGLDVLLKVFAVEHLLALLVDDLALDVHDVVVLKNAFPGLIVAALDGLLRVFDCAGENFRVDGCVLAEAEGVHHAEHALRAEQAHDVVLHREVELRLAGVALTAGPAAELVVDAAGFVPLGADDVEAAGLADEICLAVDLGLVALVGLVIGRAGGEDLGVVRLGEGIGLGDELVGETLLAQIALRHELGVAAEHDVGAAAGHIRRDGDRAEVARLRDDLGFLFVVLGVEDVVRDALALQKLA